MPAKLGEIFRFEMVYQARRASTWFYAAVLLAIVMLLANEVYIGKARSGGYFFNSPLIIAEVTLFGSMMGLFVAAAIAGDAGARDIETRLHPLMYTTPIGKGAYLGGRFLAAFVLSALTQLAVPAGLLAVSLAPPTDPASWGRYGRPRTSVRTASLHCRPVSSRPRCSSRWPCSAGARWRATSARCCSSSLRCSAGRCWPSR